MREKVITIKLLEARIRERLRRDRKYLRRPRTQAERAELGEFYIVNYPGIIVQWNINLVNLAKELNLIRPGETVEE